MSGKVSSIKVYPIEVENSRGQRQGYRKDKQLQSEVSERVLQAYIDHHPFPSVITITDI